MRDLTDGELDLLRWLGEAEFSQYGECYGDNLDGLIAKGLAQHHPNTGMDNTFIAKGRTKMFDKVSLTPTGIEVLRGDQCNSSRSNGRK